MTPAQQMLEQATAPHRESPLEGAKRAAAALAEARSTTNASRDMCAQALLKAKKMLANAKNRDGEPSTRALFAFIRLFARCFGDIFTHSFALFHLFLC